MRFIYRVKRADNSAQDYEQSNYPDASAEFLANGVSITKIRLYYTLQNDPLGQQFDQADDADAARQVLVQPLLDNANTSYVVESHYDVVSTGLEPE